MPQSNFRYVLNELKAKASVLSGTGAPASSPIYAVANAPAGKTLYEQTDTDPRKLWFKSSEGTWLEVGSGGGGSSSLTLIPWDMTPTGVVAEAVLPAGAVAGSFLEVIVPGTYETVPYSVGDVAVVLTDGTTVQKLAPEAGGGTLRDWDLTPVTGLAALEVNPFPPDVPATNTIVVAGDSSTLTKTAGTPAYGSSKLSAGFQAGDKMYFACKTYAATGAAVVDTYSLSLGTGNFLDTPVAVFNFPPGGGLELLSTQLEAPLIVDPAYAIGDVFIVCVDMVAGTVRVKTTAVDVSEAIVLPVDTVAFNLFAFDTEPDAGELRMDLAASDLGSGISIPVGFTPLSGAVQAGLPVGAVDGDHLKVTVGGTYDSVTYAVGDLAVVLDAGTGAVFPVEAKSAPVVANWTTLYEVTVGTTGTFPDLKTLMLDIENNKRHGETLGITFTDTALTANDTLVRFPSFRKVTLKAPAPMTPPADPNFVFTLDGLANEYIEVQGEIQAPYIAGFNVILVPLDYTGQTGLYATVRYNINGVYGAGVTAEGPYPYIRCGTATGAVIRDVGYVRGYATGYSAESKLEIGFTTANTGVTFLFGNIGGLIKTNRPVLLVNASFNISTLENISLSNITLALVNAVGGSYGTIINVNCGTAGLSTVFDVQYAAVHVNNITGTYTNLVPPGRLINVYDKMGGMFYEDWTGDQWAAATLLNSWTNVAGAQSAQYRIIGDRVDVRFAIEDGTALTLFTLPIGYRPAASVGATAQVHDNSGNPDFGHVRVDPNGDVVLELHGTLSNHDVWANFSFFV